MQDENGSRAADHNGKRYIPIAAQQAREDTQPSSSRRAPPKNADLMHVEDTKDKVYIYDLDSELAELESDEETPIFIPDIEKHLNKIPKQVLMSQQPHVLANNQLVLYGVPSSLSLSAEQDSVRKAIIETRARAREKQASGDVTAMFDSVSTSDPPARTKPSKTAMMQADDDAMDMD